MTVCRRACKESLVVWVCIEPEHLLLMGSLPCFDVWLDGLELCDGGIDERDICVFDVWLAACQLTGEQLLARLLSLSLQG